jgi:release factor glutamine methyltransferase
VTRVAAGPREHERRTGVRSLMEVLRLSSDYLAQHGSGSPRLDAELLLAHALRIRRLDIYLAYDRPLREPELAAARELMRRRAAGEPVAYITATREFYTRTFTVTPAVLVPRPETETLVDAAISVLRDMRGRSSATPAGASMTAPLVADLGTGSGCIAVTLAAELPGARVLASDISAEALDVARANAQAHAVGDRITFVQGYWGDAVIDTADLVVSNPPYVTRDELASTMRDVRDFEPRVALDGGDDGLDAYRRLIPSLTDRMRTGGSILLEVDPRRAGTVAAIASEVFPGASLRRHLDLSRRERVLQVDLR